MARRGGCVVVGRTELSFAAFNVSSSILSMGLGRRGGVGRCGTILLPFYQCLCNNTMSRPQSIRTAAATITSLNRYLSSKAVKLPEYPVDTSYLVSHYTAPALAAAFRDRYEVELCTPVIKDKPPTTPLDDAFSVRHLDRIKKRLNRLPRQIAKMSHKRAAVVIPLCTIDGAPHVIFTLRSSHMRFHRGEVCFPGGMVESGDTCIENTCLREMEEELGVPSSQVNVLGVLRCDWSNVASITGVAVTPVVGHIDAFDEASLNLNSDEVESLFTVPLALLVQDKFWIRPKNATPVFTAGPHLIWGLTAYVLDICIREVLLVDEATTDDKVEDVAAAAPNAQHASKSVDGNAVASTNHRRQNTTVDALLMSTASSNMDGVDALPVAPKRKQDDSVVARPPKQRKGGAHDTGKKKSASWCEESVARLFFLRYKTELANRFDSKNNNQKKEAYEMLASELSIDVNRVYSAKQVKDKVFVFDIYYYLIFDFDSFIDFYNFSLPR
ncbi:hypothetical protein DYB38_004731 [Aphanomyces astaci]|uniref:Nudix hydrolase domain-containing protein n=1 Tax=Aphanomyces astaci TaxID=112090 RepID=A0A397DGI6_APHAT|nr:hypothetical protein DYB38_004731 [Aphanomyces astaci]